MLQREPIPHSQPNPGQRADASPRDLLPGGPSPCSGLWPPPHPPGGCRILLQCAGHKAAGARIATRAHSPGHCHTGEAAAGTQQGREGKSGPPAPGGTGGRRHSSLPGAGQRRHPGQLGPSTRWPQSTCQGHPCTSHAHAGQMPGHAPTPSPCTRTQTHCRLRSCSTFRGRGAHVTGSNPQPSAGLRKAPAIRAGQGQGGRESSCSSRVHSPLCCPALPRAGVACPSLQVHQAAVPSAQHHALQSSSRHPPGTETGTPHALQPACAGAGHERPGHAAL